VARIIVVGGGAGGLAVAARLGAKRHEVSVLERNDYFGGKLRVHEGDGYRFDAGPTLFTLPAVYRDLFLKTGKPLEDEVGLSELEPGFWHRFADGSGLQLPGGSAGRTASAITEQLGQEQGDQWRALMRRAGEIWKLARPEVIVKPVESRRQLWRMARNGKAVRTVAPWRSLASMSRAHFKDPRLRKLLQRYATYSGSDPRNSPGALITIPYVEQTFGLWHIDGGLGELRDALVSRCERVGVELRPSTEVVGIRHDEQGVTGVKLADGRIEPADIVVANVDALDLYGQLLPDSSFRAGPRSYSGFALMLGIKGGCPDLQRHNVLYSQDYRQEFVSLAAGRPIADPTIYLHRVTDPGAAPAGHEAVFLLVNAPRHGQGRDAWDWSTGVDEYAALVLARLAERGIELRDRISYQHIQTPLDLASVSAADGAIYGQAFKGAASIAKRPKNVSPVPGLFLVGGSTHPGGGLPMVGISAEIVAEMIGRADGRKPSESPSCSVKS